MDAAVHTAAVDVGGSASPDIDFVALLAELSARTPRADVVLATALQAMEMVPVVDVRTVVPPAERAERIAGELGRTDLRMRARLVRAGVMLRDGDVAGSGRIAKEVHGWAAEHGDRYLLARGHRQLSAFFYHLGDVADALAHAVQCVAHTDDDVPGRIRADHLMMLAVMLGANDSLDEGNRRYQEALHIATTTGDLELSLRVLNHMAYTAYEVGQADEAQELVERMRWFAASYGLALAASDLDTIARVEMMHGRYADAEATLRPILDGSADHLVTEANGLAECLLTAAEAQRLRGDLAAAQATLDRAVRVCEERGLASPRARIREEQAQLYATADRFREAYDEFRRFHAESQALQSGQREARARALQAVFETEEARRESLRFREMAQRDALTGLHNRRFVDEQLPILLDTAVDRRAPLSVALVDLDHFKRINDALSHATGDEVLRRVAVLLAEAAGGPAAGAAQAATGAAVAARLGGEEFVLIMPETDAGEAVRRCERLREAIASFPWGPVTGGLPVTASIGVTTVENGQSTPSAVLADADRNLYAAKRSGRNRVIADAVPRSAH